MWSRVVYVYLSSRTSGLGNYQLDAGDIFVSLIEEHDWIDVEIVLWTGQQIGAPTASEHD